METTDAGIKINLLAKAIAIAAKAHQDQIDHAGAPYILHPIRVMLQQRCEVAQIVGVLHDLIEDTIWTLEQLREAGFPEEVVEAVNCLTHQKGVDYAAYIDRVRTNPTAVQVKIADLKDNLDLTRLDSISPRDLERAKKYHRYWQDITALQKEENDTIP